MAWTAARLPRLDDRNPSRRFRYAHNSTPRSINRQQVLLGTLDALQVLALLRCHWPADAK